MYHEDCLYYKLSVTGYIAEPHHACIHTIGAALFSFMFQSELHKQIHESRFEYKLLGK